MKTSTCQISFMEIYNEQIRDLPRAERVSKNSTSSKRFQEIPRALLVGNLRVLRCLRWGWAQVEIPLTSRHRSGSGFLWMYKSYTAYNGFKDWYHWDPLFPHLMLSSVQLMSIQLIIPSICAVLQRHWSHWRSANPPKLVFYKNIFTLCGLVLPLLQWDWTRVRVVGCGVWNGMLWAIFLFVDSDNANSISISRFFRLCMTEWSHQKRKLVQRDPIEPLPFWVCRKYISLGWVPFLAGHLGLGLLSDILRLCGSLWMLSWSTKHEELSLGASGDAVCSQPSVRWEIIQRLGHMCPASQKRLVARHVATGPWRPWVGQGNW